MMCLKLQQVILVPLQQIINQISILPQREYRSSQRIVKNSTVNQGGIANQGGLNCQFLNAARKLGQQGSFRRQCIDMAGIETGFIDQHRNFDTGDFGQIGDNIGIKHIAVELEHFVTLEGIDNISSVLIAVFQVFILRELGIV